MKTSGTEKGGGKKIMLFVRWVNFLILYGAKIICLHEQSKAACDPLKSETNKVDV